MTFVKVKHKVYLIRWLFFMGFTFIICENHVISFHMFY